MKKRNAQLLGVLSFILGAFLLLNLEGGITGAVTGGSSVFSSTISFILGLIMLIVGIGIMAGGKEEGGGLEKKFDEKNNWRKYPINKDSIIQDVEQEYLMSEEEDYKRTPIQERIERMVNGGKLISIPNRRGNYEEQFYEGHASKGGRVIDVESHLIQNKEDLVKLLGKKANLSKGVDFYKGRLAHMNEGGAVLAKGRYLWVVDEEGNFIIANRHNFQHEMENMNKEKIDYEHRLHKLPHATMARGKRVYGSGEVMIEGGLIKEVNTHSGHYLPVTMTPGRNPNGDENSLIEGFNNQGREVFKRFSKKYGWKEVKEGARYI